jgi:PIN domain nuclease of toxin-antitoxin system
LQRIALASFYSSDLHDHVLETGVRVLGLSAEHGLAVASLPLHHGDPFDRLLIAQARQDGLTLVTADTRIHASEWRC